MPCSGFTSVGAGRILPALRADLRRAQSSLWIVGPWLDEYFAGAVAEAAPRGRELDVRVLVRPEAEMAAEAWRHTRLGVGVVAKRWPGVECRALSGLHAKCIVIDRRVVFIGSANWYRHSVDSAIEVVVRGPLAKIVGLAEELAGLWGRAEVVETAASAAEVAGGVSRRGAICELNDPLAERVLAQVAKSFVLGRRHPRRRWVGAEPVR